MDHDGFCTSPSLRRLAIVLSSIYSGMRHSKAIKQPDLNRFVWSSN